MVWISESLRVNCQMIVGWKSSATTHAKLLAFLHCSQGSSFIFLFYTFVWCWAICNTDTCLHMRGKRLMLSLLVSKFFWNSLIVCKTIKNCKQYCKQQLVKIILVINWLIIAPISLYIFVNTNIVWGLFLVKGKYFSFYFKCNAILRLQIMSMLQITSAS